MDPRLYTLTLLLLLHIGHVKFPPLLRAWSTLETVELWHLHDVLRLQYHGDEIANQTMLALEAVYDWHSLRQGVRLVKELWKVFLRTHIPLPVKVLEAAEILDRRLMGKLRAHFPDDRLAAPWHRQCEEAVRQTELAVCDGIPHDYFETLGQSVRPESSTIAPTEIDSSSEEEGVVTPPRDDASETFDVAEWSHWINMFADTSFDCLTEPADPADSQPCRDFRSAVLMQTFAWSIFAAFPRNDMSEEPATDMKETNPSVFEDVNSLPTPMSPLSRDIARGRRQRLHELGMLRDQVGCFREHVQGFFVIVMFTLLPFLALTLCPMTEKNLA